jgi:ribonuclease HIII
MSLVFTIDQKNLEKFKEYYHKIEEKSDNPYHKYYFKTPDFTITVFNTMKVMFQGKDAVSEYNKWASVFNLDVVVEEKNPVDYDNQFYALKTIGSDEVGTGDFFGPVIVCAAYVTPSDYQFLEELGIKDSKKIRDDRIKVLGEKLINQISHVVLVTNNFKYNELTEKGFNLNKIKAYLHNHALKKLVVKHPDNQMILVDKFCSEENYFQYLSQEETVKNITLLEQAESIHMAVAVAAIIARYRFLLEFEKLSRDLGITLPKGAGPAVDAIAEVIKLKKGIDVFRGIAKLNFKNYQKLVEKKD